MILELVAVGMDDENTADKSKAFVDKLHNYAMKGEASNGVKTSHNIISAGYSARPNFACRFSPRRTLPRNNNAERAGAHLSG